MLIAPSILFSDVDCWFFVCFSIAATHIDTFEIVAVKLVSSTLFFCALILLLEFVELIISEVNLA